MGFRKKSLEPSKIIGWKQKLGSDALEKMLKPLKKHGYFFGEIVLSDAVCASIIMS